MRYQRLTRLTLALLGWRGIGVGSKIHDGENAMDGFKKCSVERMMVVGNEHV